MPCIKFLALIILAFFSCFNSLLNIGIWYQGKQYISVNILTTVEIISKLLEEEKKRVVEKIKLQFGEGQEWVKAVEISAEDMDNFLKIDQFKEKEDEKIKSIISPIIDELLKETSTNSDYLNEIIDEATTEEIQQGDYYDSEDEYEVEPLWKLRNFIWDSDESSDGEDIERFFSVKNEGYEEFKNEDTSQKGGSIRDYLDSFSKDEILKAMKQIIKKNSS